MVSIWRLEWFLLFQAPESIESQSSMYVSESPIVCGDCGSTVPLYRLPKIFGEDEYLSVLGWQRAYNACDILFMEGIGESSAYQRLSKVTSDLSVWGRKICREFEIATGKSFFYYLFRYYSSHKASCRICGEPWELGKDNQLFIDYRCESCRLVADKV